LEKRDERLQNEASEIQKANNLYRSELEWMRRQPQARGTKAQSRIDAFYEIEKKAKQRYEEEQVKLEVKSAYIGNKIFEAKYICKSFGDKKILDNFYYNFSRYEKLGIVGRNGTGKTTFLRMLMGEVKPDSGTFDIGETVNFGYFSQNGMQFDEQTKVIDVVRNIADEIDLGGGRRMSASQFLEHFLFTPQAQHNYVYKLSGGEKRRLYLCIVLIKNPNFLVLDEPTNDLDIVTLSVLEQYLQSFKGCVIVVSHDRYFMDKVVDHLLYFEGDAKIKDFPGNYTDFRLWREMKEQEERRVEKSEQKAAASTAPKNKVKKKLSFKEQREFEQLEQEIEALENEKKTLEQELSSGSLAGDELLQKSSRYGELSELIDEKTMRWLELSEM
jgi:ATP-binding cassette subfamily F protein uup